MANEEKVQTQTATDGDPLKKPERGYLDGIIDYERRLDKMRLDGVLEYEVNDLPAGKYSGIAFLQITEVLSFFDKGIHIARFFKVDACVFYHQVGELHPRPRRCKVDFIFAEVAFQRAVNRFGAGYEDVLGKVHHRLQVAERLISLKQREFGIVVAVHTLVAEYLADFIDPLDAAYHQPFVVKLEADAKEEAHIEGVEICREGLGGGAAGDFVKHRRLDFEIAALVEALAHPTYDCRALDEYILHIGVRDEVEVAVAVAKLLVLKAVVFLRQRLEGLAEVFIFGDIDCDFAVPRLEDLALGADEIADGYKVEEFIGLRADVVYFEIDLDFALVIVDIEERCFTHDAFRGDASGDAHGLPLELGEVVGYLLGIVRAVIAGAEWVDAHLAYLLHLPAPLLFFLVQGLFISVFRHIFSVYPFQDSRAYYKADRVGWQMGAARGLSQNATKCLSAKT